MTLLYVPAVAPDVACDIEGVVPPELTIGVTPATAVTPGLSPVFVPDDEPEKLDAAIFVANVANDVVQV